MPFDFRTPDEWTAPPYSTAVYANPIPVPSMCIDLTPPELWPVIWKHYPQGTEMPAKVPKYVCEAMGISGPAPEFWVSHWGKFGESAMPSKAASTERKYVQQPTLSSAFWSDYMKLFPKGHARSAHL